MTRTTLVLWTVLVVLILSPAAHAATSIPFTISTSEAVNVTGTPRIAVDVGGVTRYATYTSGSGTNALVFTYAMVSGDVDLDGVIISSPIQLNGGTIKDLNGNDATLTFTVPNTSGVLVNAAVPSGYTVAFGADTVTNANKTALSFSLTYPKANKTLNYSIASSGGGTPITGTLPTLAGTTTVSGINATTLPDGVLILSAYLSDSIGGTGSTVTDTIPMAVLDASLVGHWTFDANDISGVTAYDRSGQANNGTLTNGPTQVAGQVGGALNFDGVNDFIVASNRTASLPISSSNFTLSSWIKVNLPGGQSCIASIAAGADGWRYGYTGNYAYYLFGPNNYSEGNIGTTNIVTNSWRQLSMVFEPLSSNVTVYVDGVNAGQVPLTVTNSVGSGSHVFYIGTMEGSVGFVTGLIDDVRIYNRALTPTEIATLYNSMN